MLYEKFFLNNLTFWLFFVIIFFFFFTLVIVHYKKEKYSYTERDSHVNFLKYIDKFYITNMFYTITCILIYFLSIFGIMFYLRFNSISKIKKLNTIFPLEQGPINFTFNDIMGVICFGFLFFVVFILYKIFLDSLFFDEIIKMHLFLHNKNFYYNIQCFFSHTHFKDFCGKICLFCHNISYLRALSEQNLVDDYQAYNEYDLMYENATIQKFAYFCLSWAKKFEIIRLFFVLMRKLFHWLYLHIHFYNGFASKIPYIFVFIILMYDIYNVQFHYIIYTIYPLYMIIILQQIIKFYLNITDSMFEGDLSRYFYKNSIEYSKQRVLLLENCDVYFKIMQESKQSKELFAHLKDENFLMYIKNRCKKVFDSKEDSNRQSMYQRYLFIIFYGISLSFLILGKNTIQCNVLYLNFFIPIGYIILPLYLFSIMCSIEAYKFPKGNDYYEISSYIYKKKYAFIFWILAALQIYIFWLLLLKANLFVINDNILWKGWGIEVLKIYTLDEKKKYFWKYFFYIIVENNLDYSVLEDLIATLQEKTLKDLITENMTLNDVRILAKNVLTLWLARQNKPKAKLEAFLEKYVGPYLNKIKIIMPCVSNMTNILAIWSFAVKYMKLWNQVTGHGKYKLVADFIRIFFR